MSDNKNLLSVLYSNSGAKLKKLAKVLFCINMVLCLFTVIPLAVTITSAIDGGFPLGFLIFVVLTAVYLVITWLSVIVMYAFGELCDNAHRIESKVK